MFAQMMVMLKTWDNDSTRMEESIKRGDKVIKNLKNYILSIFLTS
jgi:hypothetical protein